MHQNRRLLIPLSLAAVGALLVCLAVVISNGAIERALLSDPSRTLSWGPTLFRVMLAVHGLALVLVGVWLRPGGSAAPATRSATHDHPDSSSEPSPKIPKWVYLALATLTLLALALRLWHLNSDLWFDEVLTLLDFVRPPLGEVITSFPSKNQHLLFSILAQVSVGAFGESAWAIRLPSVFLGVGSVWALFFLGRRVIGVRGALLACTLMTLSYHHIWFSQNARGYMGLMCFTTLATWLWLEAWGRGMGWWVAYAVVAALGAWIHMTMVFVVAAHGLLYLIWLLRPTWFNSLNHHPNLVGRQRWQPILAWLLCGSLTLQVYALALPEFLRTGIHEVSEPTEWVSLWWVVTESLRSLRLGFSGAVVLLAGGSLVCVGLWGIFRRDRLAIFSMILPPVFAGVTTLIWSHNFWPRLFFFAMGFGLLIVVHGALTLPQLLRAVLPAVKLQERWLATAGVVIAILMIIASSLTIPRCFALPKQDFTGARDFVERNRHSQDAVVAVGLAGVAYGRYFATQWASAQTQAELDAARQGHSDTWLVYTIPIQVKSYRPEIWQVIQKDFEVVKVFPGTLGGGEVFVCRQRIKNDLANHKRPDGAQSLTQ
jgi:hypothetical protein